MVSFGDLFSEEIGAEAVWAFCLRMLNIDCD